MVQDLECNFQVIEKLYANIFSESEKVKNTTNTYFTTSSIFFTFLIELYYPILLEEISQTYATEDGNVIFLYYENIHRH